jgi:hypothetical protein
VTPPLDHTIVRNGILHKPGHLTPIDAGCTLCHGENLNDGFAPSCFQCHGEIWGTGSGPPADHTELKGGSFLHKPGLEDPFANNCTQCHGPNLNDGFATSCYTCHGQIWAGGGPPPDHTELKGGTALHKPGAGEPFTNACTQCHGPNLNDGFAPSCTTCHEPLWAGSDPPSNHTELKGGFAEHKPGFGNPLANGCTQCHGPNLNDGFASSCFSCHGQIWAGSGPPADHTERKGGFADHKPGLGDPFANGCTQCHGPNLNDGFANSCFSCHGAIWASNDPPVADAGGPYAGVPGQAVSFDASGTTDPNEEDVLTYSWDFGDGSDPTTPSQAATASHVYSLVGTYTATLTVSDGVNAPVKDAVAVSISQGGSTAPAESWDVTIWKDAGQTTDPKEAFGITFENHNVAFLAIRNDGVNPPSLGIGIEYVGVIFWMDIWMDMWTDASGNVLWGTGNTYFGNINHAAGTMLGVVFDNKGGVLTFTGEKIAGGGP